MALMSLAKLTLCIFALGTSTALDVDGTCANGGSCAKKSTTQTSQLSAEGPVVDNFGLIQSTHTLAQRMSGNLNITPTDLPKEDTAQNTGQPTAQKQRAFDVIEKATTRFSMEKLMQFNTSIREMRQMFGSHFTPENQAVIQEVIDALAKHLEENVKRDQNSAKGEVVTRIADLTEKTNSVVAQKTESDDADTSHSTCVTEEVRLLTAHKTCTDEETQLTTDKPTNEFCGNPILKPVVYQNSPDLIAYLSEDISIDYSKAIADINADLAGHAAEVNRLMDVWIDAQKLIAVTEKGNWETYNQKCIDITKDLADKTAECGEKLAAWQLQHEQCLHEKSAQQMSLCAFGYKYQMKCDSKIEYETTRDGINGTGTVLSESDREQEFTHFNRIMCVLDTFKTTIEFDSGAVDACTLLDDQAADKFTAEVGRIDLQEDEYETLTSQAKFTCNEAQITFGNGDLWTVPENTDGVAGWLPTADDYSKATGYAYAIKSDQSNAPFEFCLGSGDHPTAPTCGSAYDCSAGSGSAKPATTPCHLDGGCTSADCCEGMFPAPEVILTGTASQSSTHSDDWAVYGNDGLTSTMAHTIGYHGETNPWWQVDLGRTASVDKIKFYNRPFLCASRLFLDWGCNWETHTSAFSGDDQGATFGVSATSCVGDTCDGTLCGRLLQPNADGSHMYTVDCSGKVGRYVYVILPGPERMLNFMEMTVFGQA